MVIQCSVSHCSTQSDNDAKSLFSLPCVKRGEKDHGKVESINKCRQKWLQRLKMRDPGDVTYIRVCEDHFVSGHLAACSEYHDKDWAPTLKLDLIPLVLSPRKRKVFLAQRKKEGEARRLQKRAVRIHDKLEKQLQKQLQKNAALKRKLEKREKQESERVAKQRRKEEKEATKQRDIESVNRELEQWVELKRREEEEVRLSLQLVEEDGYTHGGHVEDPDGPAIIVNVFGDEGDDLPKYKAVGIQTMITMDMLQDVFEEVTRLRQDVRELIPGEHWLKSDGQNSKFDTGLSSYVLLREVFHHLIEPFLSDQWTAVGKCESFLMTLMILRLNLRYTDIAYRFDVDRSTVSRHFKECLGVMFLRLKKFVLWPKRKVLKETMPKSFRKTFGDKVTSVIDCFEVLTQTATNIMGRAQLWSSYKHHESYKILISITPQGTISFISKAWGGRTSDKTIPEESGFLDNLRHGDLVLADRGFTIYESVAIRGANIRIPAFTKGKSQLDAVEVEETRALANVCVHVERVIGVLRSKYNILRNIVPIFLLESEGFNMRLFDEIVTTCALLVNLCPSVVPFD